MDTPEQTTPQTWASAKPVGKGHYFAALATPKTKKTAKLAWIVALACVLVMVFGYITAITTSFEDVPFMSTIINDEDGAEEMKEDMENMADDLEDIMDTFDDEIEDLSKKDQKALKNLLKVMRDTSKTISLNNLNRLTKAMTKVANSEAGEIGDLDQELEDLEEVSTILSTISGVALWAMIITVFFTALGGLFRSNALVIVGAILTTVYCFAFCGFLFVLLNLAAHAFLFILHRKLNAEYKAYKAGTLEA